MLDSLLAASSLPNLHPALVHFPLALLPLAVAFDLVAVITLRRWFDRVALTLYGIGVVVGWWAAEAGEEAAESFVDLPAVLEPEIAEHSDMAHYALYAFAVVFVLRLVFALWDRAAERLRWRGARAGALVIAAVGLFFLFEASEHGGALVYGHGLAVSSDATLFQKAPPTEPLAATAAAIRGAPANAAADPLARRLLGDDGSLVWTPLRRDALALGSVLFPVAGFPRGAVEAVASTAADPGLDVSVFDRAILVFPQTVGDVRIEAELMLDEFTGTVGVAHHVVSAEAASWFEVSTTGGVALKLAQSGTVLTLEAKDIAVLPDSAVDGVVRLAVSSTGRHRKGIVNGAAVVHGHIDPTAEAGRAGLLFDGRGRVRVRRVTVEPLHPE